VGHRSVRDWVATELWLAWAAFVAAPCLVMAGVVIAYYDSDAAGMAAFTLTFFAATAFVGCLVQFVVFGHASPKRLFQRTEGTT